MDHHNALSRRRGRNSIGTALLRSALALLGAALASKAFATEDIFWAPISSSSIGSGYYGRSVASTDSQFFVGAPFQSPGAFSSAGAVHVLSENLGPVTVLTPSDPAANDYFGSAVHTDGGALVVGAPQNSVASTNGGKAYVFERSGGTWAQTAKLVGLAPAARDSFGTAVAISGTRVFVGASSDDIGALSNAGTVTVFQKTGANWTTVSELKAATPAAAAGFGDAISASGDRVAISAPGESANGFTSAGAVYIFERSGSAWVQTARIIAPLPADFRAFGSAVYLSGTELAVSSINEQVAGLESAGRVYIYSLIGGSWNYTGLLEAAVPKAYDYFGGAIARRGERLAIGTLDPNDVGGRVELFERTNGNWIRLRSLTDSANGGSYGESIVFQNDERLLIGSATSSPGGRVHLVERVDAFNLDNSQSVQGPALPSLVASADPGAPIGVRSAAFDWSGIADLSMKPVRFIAAEPVTIGADLLVRLASQTQFEMPVGQSDFGVSVAGQLISPENGTLTFDKLATVAGGQFVQDGATLLVNQSLATTGGRAYLKGTIAAESVTTSGTGQNRVAGDVDCFADYDNAGTTIIQRGVLYIYGSLTNSGVLTGEYDNGYVPPAPGDGYSIGGDYSVAPQASLLLPESAWWLRVGGDLDVAIDSPSRFAMSEATIEMTGLGKGGAQTIEAMSADMGASLAGFAASNYPVGALRLRAGSTTAVVDAHANSESSEGGCEVIYTKLLEVPAGATLVTAGCPIYTQQANIAGSVSDPGDIVLVPTAPPCPADINLDGRVDAADILVVLAFWNNPTGYPRADVNQDGLTDAADLTAVLLAWGACG